MKVTKRKRKERRLRILERNAMRRRARETAVAANLARERRTEHRKRLAARLYDAISEQHARKFAEPTQKVSFLRRLLGRN